MHSYSSRWLMLTRRELVALVLVFAASLPAVTVRLYSSDEVEYFSYLRSLWFDHDVSFENEYKYFADHGIAQTPDFHETFLERQTATGRRVNFGTIGCAILWTPFYAAADLVVRLMRAAGRETPADGFSHPYVAAVAYGSACYGFAAILLSISAARRVLGHVSLVPGVVVWVGTPLLFYMYVAPPFSHACSAFAVALFVTAWLLVRDTWTVRGVVALGAAGALMTMVREQDLLFLAGPAVDFALWGAGGGSSRRGVAAGRHAHIARAAIAGGAAFALAYLPQLLAYNALNGRRLVAGFIPLPGPSSLVTRKMLWQSPYAWRVLADTEHGFFWWTPLAVLCVAGLVGMIVVRWRGGTEVRLKPDGGTEVRLKPDGGTEVRLKPDTTGETKPDTTGETKPDTTGEKSDATGEADVRRIGSIALLMLALQVYISGAVASWTVAGAFGQRRFVAVTILLVLGLSALWELVRRRAHRPLPAVLAAAAMAICVWWNLALMAEFGISLMDRQRLELRRNAHDAFVTLPQMAPDLLRRYFTARESFYKPPAEAPK